MNKLERVFYDRVKSHPRLKRVIRNVYQSMFTWRQRTEVHSSHTLKVYSGLFFGFHDLKQISLNDEFLLANRADFDLRMPTHEDKLEVGFVPLHKAGDFVAVGTTQTWNWHMGCRLQWVEDCKILGFNDLSNGRAVFRCVTLDGRRRQTLPYHISMVHADTKIAVGYDMFTVNEYMPGYGYTRGELDKGGHDNEKSLYVIDIESEIRLWSVTYEYVKSLLTEEIFSEWNFFITHATISPDGKSIAFLARVSAPDKERRRSALLVFDQRGNFVCRVKAGLMVSHYCWLGGDKLLAYCSNHSGSDGYVIFDAKSGEVEAELDRDILTSDGHPTSSDDGKFFTDTYPDRSRIAKLIEVSRDGASAKTLARIPSDRKFQSPNVDSHWSCDLHPRISSSGRLLSFDSCHGGVRSTCVLDLTPK